MNAWKLGSCKDGFQRRVLWFAYRRVHGITEYAERDDGKIRTWPTRDDAAESLEIMELESATA